MTFWKSFALELYVTFQSLGLVASEVIDHIKAKLDEWGIPYMPWQAGLFMSGLIAFMFAVALAAHVPHAPKPPESFILAVIWAMISGMILVVWFIFYVVVRLLVPMAEVLTESYIRHRRKTINKLNSSTVRIEDE